jgi:5-(aminomethyl)-3-furanmethanol phosphate kinase
MLSHPIIAPHEKALVVKLGGSLYDHVPELAEVFRAQSRPLFIVPGGGRFADEVRQSGFSDDDAHWAAIAAMDRYGRYIASFGLDTTDQLKIPKISSVFLPYHCMRHHDPLPHTWDVTSDTIAAWIAGRLGRDLLVLKSVDGIRLNDTLTTTISTSVNTDVVDPCFIPYVLQHGVSTVIINGSRPEIVARFLQGDHVPCTRIGTTF